MNSICAIGRGGLRSGIERDEKIEEDRVKVTDTKSRAGKNHDFLNQKIGFFKFKSDFFI